MTVTKIHLRALLWVAFGSLVFREYIVTALELCQFHVKISTLLYKMLTIHNHLFITVSSQKKISIHFFIVSLFSSFKRYGITKKMIGAWSYEYSRYPAKQ